MPYIPAALKKLYITAWNFTKGAFYSAHRLKLNRMANIPIRSTLARVQIRSKASLFPQRARIRKITEVVIT
jgi:hypothetical protein